MTIIRLWRSMEDNSIKILWFTGGSFGGRMPLKNTKARHWYRAFAVPQSISADDDRRKD